ncbi:hypothetical protein HHI36_023318 [Cryptolaemus montrouzieri]|uniref:Uncharacterized protein n=1 Tax=Cryptolaemus montrouzieri TaxID=559131 RepID=A0ABD2PG75_9CUCU
MINIEQEEVGYTDIGYKNLSMTQEILLMDTRRSYKGINKDKYNEVNREIRGKIRKAKEEWMRTKCEKIEELKKKHDTFVVHKKSKRLPL